MKVHHLNCGSMREIEPVDGVGAPLPAVCHCLLVETPEHGLVLIESGIGSADVREPELRLGADCVALVGPARAPDSGGLSPTTP